jgi:hypothetical protein
MALFRDFVPSFPPGQAVAQEGQTNNVTATGSTLANSTLLTSTYSFVTGADGTKGVTLPIMAVNESCVIYNNSASSLIVWPGSGTIAISAAGSGLGTAGSSATLTTYKQASYRQISATQVIASA